jgi:DNA-binding MarR family transcriptional regulator
LREVSSNAEDGRVADKVWLTPSQGRTWLSYMGVYHRLEFEMNRQLQAECGLSLADYTVMNALSAASGRRLRLSQLATTIGWERSRLSHHLQRMAGRGLVDRVQSDTDGRATDALLTDTGLKTLRAAAPKHVAWVRTLFFSDLDEERVVELGSLLDDVYRTILREGTLPTPESG